MNEDIAVCLLPIMVVLFFVGFIIGASLIAGVAKLLGGALRPTLPATKVPTRTVVVRKRIIQVETRSSGVTTAPGVPDQQVPRPKLSANSVQA